MKREILMIKSLLNPDEEPLPAAKTVTDENTFISPSIEEIPTPTAGQIPVETGTKRSTFEIPEDARFFAKPPETLIETEPHQPILQAEPPPVINSANDFQHSEPETVEVNYFEPEKIEEKVDESSQPTIFQKSYQPETTGETIHNSGLAYSAAIVLFASIVFMMMLGWVIGQLIGNSTGGIVGGIILGAIIGFVQFFRITSSIFKK